MVIIQIGGINGLGAVTDNNRAGDGGANGFHYVQLIGHSGRQIGQFRACQVAGIGGARGPVAVLLGQLRQQQTDRRFCIAPQRLRYPVTAKLIFADINPDHSQHIGKAAIHIHIIVRWPKFSANRQHLIRRRNHRACRRQTGRGGNPQNMPKHHATCVHRLHHRRIQPPRQQRQNGIAPACATTRQNDHAVRRVQCGDSGGYFSCIWHGSGG